MTGTLQGAGVGVQVVGYAYLALLTIALVVMWGAPIFGRLAGRGGRIPDPFEAVAGVGIAIGVPGGMAAGLALLVSPLLVAMPLPLAGWAMIACLSLYGLYHSTQIRGSGMEGCTRLMTGGFAGFGVCWAVTAILFADPPVGDAGFFLRPLIIAAPLALFSARLSRKNRVAHALGVEFFVAALAAIAFLPVEAGFAAALLPTSDWLRFPIVGAVGFAIWPLLSIPLTLLFGKRVLHLRKTGRTIAVTATVGGLFGLVWAFTRLLF